nr:MAG TPA: bacteriocin [Caudoviricetes sp.]
MPNNVKGKLKEVLEDVKGVTEEVVEEITAPILDPFRIYKSFFDRRNIVNAILPKPAAALVNGAWNYFENGKKAKNAVPAEKPPKNVSRDISEPYIADGEDDSLDADDLVEAIEEGFDHTDELLERIIQKLDGTTDVVLENDSQELPDVVLETSEEDQAVLAELVELNGEIIDRLDEIAANTRRDELKEREAELEKRSPIILPPTVNIDPPKETKQDENSLIGKAIEKLAGGALLGRGVKGAMGASKAAFAAGKGAVAAEASVAKGIVGASKGGIAKALGKIAGKAALPLTLATSAMDVYATSQRADISQDEKTVEYSKVGGQTVGALGGAKLGAMLGAPLGPIGAAVGGILGGIGGYFFGDKAGEVVGGLINAISPDSDKDIQKLAPQPQKDLSIEEIVPKTEKAAENVLSSDNVRELIAPEIVVTPTETRIRYMEGIIEELERGNVEKAEAMKQTIIAAIPAPQPANNVSQPQQPVNTRIGVPSVRNQDGTIQRILDRNVSTIFR